MPRRQARHESSTAQAVVCLAVGAATGVAVGIAIAQRFGGFGALTARIYDSFHKDHLEGYDAHDYDEDALSDDDFEEDDSDEGDFEEDVFDDDEDAGDEEADLDLILNEDEEGDDDEDSQLLDESDFDDEEANEFDAEPLTGPEALEERVLVAYHNDPILSQRAIEIGATDAETIELTGWVHSAHEVTHAETMAKGTPGVQKVINKLTVREDGSIH